MPGYKNYSMWIYARHVFSGHFSKTAHSDPGEVATTNRRRTSMVVIQVKEAPPVQPESSENKMVEAGTTFVRQLGNDINVPGVRLICAEQESPIRR